jgi:putative ABC transport system permease protein
VSADFLRTIGVRPALGREFLPEETRAGGRQAVILSDGLWQHIFGGDPNVAGRSIVLDNVTYTVAGVLPRTFWFRYRFDALLPFQAMDIGANETMVARLKPGIGMSQAAAQLRTFTGDLVRAIPRGLPDGYQGLAPTPYQGLMNDTARTTLLLLFGAVGLLLLIACSNLAGLALARFASRQKEIAVRMALGGSAPRLFRQFLVENVLLSAAGGLAGLLAAVWLMQGLLAIVPFELPSARPIGLDLPVLAFTFGVAVVTNLIFSLAPVLSATGLDVNQTLKAGSRFSGGSPRQRTRSLLVTGQVAVSVTDPEPPRPAPGAVGIFARRSGDVCDSGVAGTARTHR